MKFKFQHVEIVGACQVSSAAVSDKPKYGLDDFEKLVVVGRGKFQIYREFYST